MEMRRLRKLRSKLFLDRATADSTVFLAGMGRSGTSWTADLINYDGTYRLMFEPFHPRVRAGHPFHCVQYMNHHSWDLPAVESARRILSGRLRNKWVDVDNRRFILRRRIIKEVRCNLMLRWLKDVCPEMRVVLMIRHPLSVALSWLSLGWGADRIGSDFEIMIGQRELFDDFPVLGELLRRIDVEDAFERVLFQWCAFHVVPLSQFTDHQLTIVFYENLVLEPLEELKIVFADLGRAYDASRLWPLLEKPSLTDFLHRTKGPSKSHLLDSWNDAFTQAQIRRSVEILQTVGLESMYANGRPCTTFSYPACETLRRDAPDTL